MPDEVTLTIDNHTISVPEGTTLLEASRSIGQAIPTICYHEACTANGLCRTCVVEVEGARVLAAACVTRAGEGMVVHTGSERVQRSRRTIMELLASTVDLAETPEAQAIMAEYQADPQRFPDSSKREIPLIDDNPMYIRDYSKCVLCWRCVQVCAADAQYTFALNFSGRGFDTQIGTFFDKSMPETTCVFCGQCVGVCPSGALKSKREWLIEQEFSPEAVFEATRLPRKRRQR